MTTARRFRHGFVATRALAMTPNLGAFLPEVARVSARRSGLARADVLVVEGCAQGAPGAEPPSGKPCIALAPGPLSSISRNVPGALLVGMTASGAGLPNLAAIAFDAGDDAEEALRLMALKAEQGLTVANGPPRRLALGGAGRRRILILGSLLREPFAPTAAPPAGSDGAMLHSARAEADGAWLGLFDPSGRLGRDPQIAVLADAVVDPTSDLHDLLACVDEAYVVDSFLGFEALLAGLPVRVFGHPAYAGRGLTRDEAAPAGQPASLQALFAAAYLHMPRYVDPLTGQRCGAALAFERLAAFRQHARRVAGPWVAVNIPPPKLPVLRAFVEGPFSRLGGPASGPGARKAVWASWSDAAARRARSETPSAVVNVEDGFLRSVGLGSSFKPASSLIFDSQGVYYDPSRRSDLEALLCERDPSPGELKRAAELREAVVELRLSKYNLPPEALTALPREEGRPVILVPGQVEDDASVRLGGGGLSNLALLRMVRAANPGAFIVFKEHPDVTAGNRKGRVDPAEAARLADRVLAAEDILACIEAADEVHTLTSLAGFEALIRGKAVVTYGWPFYAGWGLTRDLAPGPTPARRTIGLDALVAGALVQYPLYLDPLSWLPCDALTFVGRLREQRELSRRQGDERPAGPVRRILTAIGVMLRSPRPPMY